MTLRTNARLAGAMFLLYIATGIGSMMLSSTYTGRAGAGGALAQVAEHATAARLNVLLTLLQGAYAVGLGVTLYALTRRQDTDLARLALCCRLGEGMVGVVAAVRSLGLVSLATTAAAAKGPDAAAANALGGFLLGQGSATIAATLFAAGSTLFCYLFLRARSIPTGLAWLGLAASALLIVGLPLQILTGFRGSAAYLIWIPMAVFEVAFAVWLIVKGVRRTSNGTGDSPPALEGVS